MIWEGRAVNHFKDWRMLYSMGLMTPFACIPNQNDLQHFVRVRRLSRVHRESQQISQRLRASPRPSRLLLRLRQHRAYYHEPHGNTRAARKWKASHTSFLGSNSSQEDTHSRGMEDFATILAALACAHCSGMFPWNTKQLYLLVGVTTWQWFSGFWSSPNLINNQWMLMTTSRSKKMIQKGGYVTLFPSL